MATPITPAHQRCHQGLGQFIVKWGPRTVVAALAAYYGLGIAYEMGIMAEIDKMLIRILKHYGGYAGIGAMMPTAQWYAALAVRISIGVIAGLIYDLIERCIKLFYRCIRSFCCKAKTAHA